MSMKKLLLACTWPACLYAASGEAKIFQAADDVPEDEDWRTRPHNHPRDGEDRKAPKSVRKKDGTTPSEWPAWYDGPNGEEAVYECAEDVPEGWTDRRTEIESAPKPPVVPLPEDDARIISISDAQREDIEMTKKEAIKILRDAEIPYHRTSKADDLVRLVLWALEQGIIKED